MEIVYGILLVIGVTAALTHSILMALLLPVAAVIVLFAPYFIVEGANEIHNAYQKRKEEKEAKQEEEIERYDYMGRRIQS